LSVVRKEKQTFARFIKASHGRYPGEVGAQKTIINGSASFLIRCGGEKTPRFIQHDIYLGHGNDTPTIHFYGVVLEIYRLVPILANNAIEEHTSRRDHG